MKYIKIKKLREMRYFKRVAQIMNQLKAKCKFNSQTVKHMIFKPRVLFKDIARH